MAYYSKAHLEKISISEGLVTLLYICRVVSTPQLKAEVLNSTTIAVLILATVSAVSVSQCFMGFETHRVFYNLMMNLMTNFLWGMNNRY